MRLHDVIQATQAIMARCHSHIAEGYEDDVKTRVRDALVNLKIQGIDRVKTSSILQDFHDHGIIMTADELVSLLQQDDLVVSADDDMVVIGQSTPHQDSVPQDSQAPEEIKREKISNMAKKALAATR